jgi:hypothetical protein
MKIKASSETELLNEGLNVLMKHLPPFKVARLLSLWRVGGGDYTVERRKLFSGATVESLFAKAHTLEKRSRENL